MSQKKALWWQKADPRESQMDARSIDHYIFKTINSDWANSVFDQVMPVITDIYRAQGFWVVFPLLLIAIGWKLKRKLPIMLLLLALSLGTSDLLGHRVLKPYFARTRPQFVIPDAILRSPIHYGYSFPSNHASNCFATATMLSLFIPVMAPVFLLGAAAIAYSRVYVGVHFPADVLAGAMVGALLSLIYFLIYRGIVKRRSQT
jgi:undecaprenyl-diphosphatase